MKDTAERVIEEVQNLPRGQVLWLDDPQRVWQVSEGEVDVFAVTGIDCQQYQQVFLHQAGIGRMLFGLSREISEKVRLMITAPRGAILIVKSRAELLESDGSGSLSRQELLSLVREWLESLFAEPGTDISRFGQFMSESSAVSFCEDREDIWQIVEQSHHLFADHLTAWFVSEAKRDSERLVARRLQQERMLYGAASHLLRTEMTDIVPVTAMEGISSPLLMVMKAVAARLGIDEQQVRLPRGVDPLRQDMTLLKNIARLSGMQPRVVCLDPGWQRQDNGPLIGYYGPQRRLVALLPYSPNEYRLFDPGNPDVLVVGEEIAQMIDPLVYTFYAYLPRKSVSVGGLLAFLLKKCWPGDLFTVLFVSVVAGMIPMLTPLVTQTIFEDIIPINDRQGLLMVVQIMMVAAFATAGVAFARGITVLRIKSRSRIAGEAALWLRLLSLPATFFRQYQAGDLAQRMNSISQISALLTNSVWSALFNTLFSMGSLLVMLYYSWQLTLAAVSVWVVYLAISAFLVWRIVVAKRRMTDASGKTAGQVLQIFNGLSKFRMQGAETQAFYLWAKQFGEQWKWNRAFRWTSNWLEFINAIQPVILTMLIFWLTMDFISMTEKGEQGMTLPQFMAFNAALTGFNATLTGMVSVATGMMDIVPQIERIRPILEAEPEVTDENAEVGELTGHIEVSNVIFRYAPDLPPVLRQVSLTIPPGQFVAIVGSSGSGKSTLLRLLLGFEQPESGSLYFDGQELLELNITSVRSQMGVVLQGGQLMAGDLLSNIIGSLPLTIDDAWQAAEMVGLADDIRAMPMGMHTMISEGGSNISGGQRQRILIARSIVHRPRIIIFDEATSALDNKTQAIVTESLAKLNATRIVVAHRLSTVIDADVIYVMDKGEIVESGTYHQLMSKNGLFAALAKRQLV